jgi:DNA repair photolyase
MPIKIQSKSILNKTKKRDAWFLDDYTINPYSGCSFNCLYCYIRGSKYGTHMEEKLAVKQNAVQLLEKQLMIKAKKRQYGFVVMSSATDPYLQVEKSLEMTRNLLRVFLRFQFPVHIITKSDLVLRDFDLLERLDKEAILPDDLKLKLSRGALITFSFSTLDERIGKIFEPGATPVSLRLRALEKAAKAGFKTGVSLMPLLPLISDSLEQLDLMYSAFRDAGAHYIMPAGLTLFGTGHHDSKTLTMRAIANHFPNLFEEYERMYGNAFNPSREYQSKLSSITDALNVKYGVNNRIA